MTLTNLDQQNLMDGDTLVFIDAERELQLEAWFDNDSGWQGGFKIWFNGTFVHISKTFKPFEKKLNALVAKHGLVPEEV